MDDFYAVSRVGHLPSPLDLDPKSRSHPAKSTCHAGQRAKGGEAEGSA